MNIWMYWKRARTMKNFADYCKLRSSIWTTSLPKTGYKVTEIVGAITTWPVPATLVTASHFSSLPRNTVVLSQITSELHSRCTHSRSRTETSCQIFGSRGIQHKLETINESINTRASRPQRGSRQVVLDTDVIETWIAGLLSQMYLLYILNRTLTTGFRSEALDISDW